MEKSTSTENLKFQLTKEEVAQVIWLSFFFSQGGVPAQEAFLGDVRNVCGPQKFPDVGELVDFVLDTKFRTSKDRVFPADSLMKNGYHRYINEPGNEVVSGEDTSAFHTYIEILSDIKPQVMDNKSYLLMCLESDYLYLKTKGERPGKAKTELLGDRDNPLKDRQFSFLVHYILRDKRDLISMKTRLGRVIDSVLKGYKKELIGLIKGPYTYEESELDKKFEELLKKYNLKHPNNKVTSDELRRIGFGNHILFKFLDN